MSSPIQKVEPLIFFYCLHHQDYFFVMTTLGLSNLLLLYLKHLPQYPHHKLHPQSRLLSHPLLHPSPPPPPAHSSCSSHSCPRRTTVVVVETLTPSVVSLCTGHTRRTTNLPPRTNRPPASPPPLKSCPLLPFTLQPLLPTRHSTTWPVSSRLPAILSTTPSLGQGEAVNITPLKLAPSDREDRLVPQPHHPLRPCS